MHPDFDVLRVDWQNALAGGCHPSLAPRNVEPGPWLLVTLGQRSDAGNEAWAETTYAIFKRTGAIHFLGLDGAVSDVRLPI